MSGDLPRGPTDLWNAEPRSAERVRLENLTADLAWPSKVVGLAEIDSTNSYAKRLIADRSEVAATPCLIIADRQTAGRGRGDKRWISDSGSLTFSVVFSLEAIAVSQPEELASLPLLVGIAIAETFAAFVEPRPRVKWPNDIYVDGRKVAGILMESTSVPGEPTAFVVGIGINCDADPANQDADLAGRTTNLRRHLAAAESCGLSPDQLKRVTLHRVLSAIQMVLADVPAAASQLPRRWPLYCLLTARWVTVRSGDDVIEGECVGIDERGALLVREPGGGWRSILAGEVLKF